MKDLELVDLLDGIRIVNPLPENAEEEAKLSRLQRWAVKANALLEKAGKCQTCGESLGAYCDRCRRLWES